MLLSELACRSVAVTNQCLVVFSDTASRLLFVPDASVYLVMDLSGKHFVLPSVLALKEPMQLYVSRHAPVVVVRMPQNLKSNQLIDTGDGVYELVDEWAEVAYVELLEQFHRYGMLYPDYTEMLLSWSQFRAHKGHSEFIKKYTNALLEHLSEDRLDSRAMRRAYKQYFGRSPQQLQTFIKFNNALNDYIHKGIEPHDSYADQAHWIRVCKKHTGMTPKTIASWHIVL